MPSKKIGILTILTFCYSDFLLLGLKVCIFATWNIIEFSALLDFFPPGFGSFISFPRGGRHVSFHWVFTTLDFFCPRFLECVSFAQFGSTPLSFSGDFRWIAYFMECRLQSSAAYHITSSILYSTVCVRLGVRTSSIPPYMLSISSIITMLSRALADMISRALASSDINKRWVSEWESRRPIHGLGC